MVMYDMEFLWVIKEETNSYPYVFTTKKSAEEYCKKYGINGNIISLEDFLDTVCDNLYW